MIIYHRYFSHIMALRFASSIFFTIYIKHVIKQLAVTASRASFEQLKVCFKAGDDDHSANSIILWKPTSELVEILMLSALINSLLVSKCYLYSKSEFHVKRALEQFIYNQFQSGLGSSSALVCQISRSWVVYFVAFDALSITSTTALLIGTRTLIGTVISMFFQAILNLLSYIVVVLLATAVWTNLGFIIHH